MGVFGEIRFLLRITRSHGIVRRYFVVNGFDGALTMLGLITGFYLAGSTDLVVAISACVGAAIALAASGVTSAYISEAAERKKELAELEQAMIAELQESAHGRAARLVPMMIALVNGLAPLSISLLIIVPLWLGQHDVALPASPLLTAIGVAFATIFLLGAFLGRISHGSWLAMGMRTLLIGVITMVLILLVGR